MRCQSQKGTVILVALSCVTVLGIALASFLAVSNQAMKLSNRAYAKEVSKHLAEMGLERALRSFYDSVPFSSWTLSGTTAKLTLTTVSSPHLPTTYGNSGITPVVNLRVDHYNATLWSAAATYTTNSMVWYRGIWFQCITGNTNQVPPNPTYWASAPAAWSSAANYNVNDIALVGGLRYLCNVANANQSPLNGTYWSAGGSVAAWSAATSYVVNDIAILGGTAYRCIAANSNQTPPNATCWVSAPVIYSEGVATLPDSSSTTIKTQLHATIAPAPLFPNALGATMLVSLPSTGSVDSYNQPLASVWDSAITYTVGALARSGTTVYRCIATSTNNPPPDATIYWAKSSLGYSAVIAGGNTGGTAVSVTSAVVGGYVAAPSSITSPYAPQVSFGVNSTVSLKNANGTVTSPHPTAPNVDLTRISRSPYVPQFDIRPVTDPITPLSVPAPTTLADANTTLGDPGATTPTIYNITGTYQGVTLNSGLYLSNADILIIDGPVILNVTGPLYTYGGRIVINPTGSLEIYFTGQLYVGSGAISGIQNLTFDPKKCILVGTNSNTGFGTHYYWSTDPFYGTIYMPNAYVSTWSTVTIYGAISAKAIAFPNADGILHYDTSLRTAGKIGTYIDAPYKITEWRELADLSERVVLP